MKTSEQIFDDLVNELFPKAIKENDVFIITITNDNLLNLSTLFYRVDYGLFNKKLRLKLDIDCYLRACNRTYSYVDYPTQKLELEFIAPNININMELRQ